VRFYLPISIFEIVIELFFQVKAGHLYFFLSLSIWSSIASALGFEGGSRGRQSQVVVTSLRE